MVFDAAFYSETGGRPVNEDTVSVSGMPERLLALAADGLGGMGCGDEASADAVAYLSGLIRYRVEEDTLCKAILEANQRILSMHGSGKQMMTTIAVLWSDGNQTLTATVGDTRLYQFRDGHVRFQSTDHSVAQLAVFSGEITREQLRGYPGRNRLLRALGAEPTVQIELEERDIRPGDRFLLCSDGFWELVVEQEMLAWEKTDTAAAWLERMKALAVSRCGLRGDNHSAAAVIVTEEMKNAD